MELKKDVFRLVTSVAQRKILSPHEESSVSVSDSARISNVDSVMFVDRNKRDGKF